MPLVSVVLLAVVLFDVKVSIVIEFEPFVTLPFENVILRAVDGWAVISNFPAAGVPYVPMLLMKPHPPVSVLQRPQLRPA